MRESKIRKVVQLTKNSMTTSIGKTSVVYWLSVGHWCFGQLWFFFIEIKWTMFTIGDIGWHCGLYIDQHSVDTSGDYQSTIGQYIAALLTDSQSSVGWVIRLTIGHMSIEFWSICQSIFNWNSTDTCMGKRINNKQLIPNWHLTKPRKIFNWHSQLSANILAMYWLTLSQCINWASVGQYVGR